jgi:hypothetical protein
MRKITLEWLKKQNACIEGTEWFKNQKASTPVEVLNKLIAENKIPWANWLIVRVMTYKQRVSYGVFAAEQVIGIYEKKYPDDKRPRNAIEAAKKCITNPSKKNRVAAWDAAWDAARDAWGDWAAWDAAWDAARDAWGDWDAWVDWGAARAAGDAAWAAWDAAWAAGDAARAAGAAGAAAWAAGDAARDVMQLKILQYGLKLIASKLKGKKS